MTSSDQPDRVVMIDGEDGHELLTDGEVGATLYEPDGDDDLQRQDVRIVNTAGPHPLFSPTTSGTKQDPQSLKQRLPYIGVLVGIIGAVFLGMMYLIPESTITINGEPVPLFGTGPEMWGALVLVLGLSLLIEVVPYLRARVSADG